MIVELLLFKSRKIYLKDARIIHTGNIVITSQIYIFRRLKNDLENLKNNLYKNIVF